MVFGVSPREWIAQHHLPVPNVGNFVLRTPLLSLYHFHGLVRREWIRVVFRMGPSV